MTKINCVLMKISLATMLMGLILTGYSQSINSNNPVVYNQSGMGSTILIIFAGLILILLAFKYLGKYMTRDEKSKVKPGISPTVVVPKTDQAGEVHAAIAMALYLYSNELHDQENPVITMIKVSRTYSPWSSKIYGLRKSPR